MVAAVVHGCSGPAAAADGGVPPGTFVTADGTDFASGTRLKARYYRSDEGARLFEQWFDTTLAATCAYSVATDGRERCLPSGANGTDQIVYLDAACTQPAVYRYVPTTCGYVPPPVAPYVVTDGSHGCGREVHRVGDEILPSPSSLYSPSGSGCMSIRASDETHAYRFGELVAPDRFVARAMVRGDGTTRLVATSDVGDDGSSRRRSWYDRQLDTECRAARTRLGGADVTVCMPVTAITSHGYWTDRACSQPAPVSYPDTCPTTAPPRFARVGDAAGCRTENVFALGDEISTDALFTGAPDCQPVTIASGAGYPSHAYRLGAPIASDTLARLDVQRVPSNGRLQVTQYASAPGVPPQVLGVAELFGAPWFDSMFATRCTVGSEGAGDQCFPQTTLDVRYGDAGCMGPAYFSAPPGFTCDAEPLQFGGVLGAVGACGLTVTYRRFGAAATVPAMAYVRSDNTCLALGAPAAGTTFWRVGDAVPASAFARLTYVHEDP